MERQELLNEVKKSNNTKVIQEKMAKTFSIRWLEIVRESPAADDFRERWPALFCEDGIKEEFRRITTMSLEQSFITKALRRNVTLLSAASLCTWVRKWRTFLKIARRTAAVMPGNMSSKSWWFMVQRIQLMWPSLLKERR
ncbi:hypothetical protein AALO_G00190400 [Alosa alosa]|uniref:Uncharacterized protein n=1 Tax=Alosa alosa TaxID=278164 RepID=A0AAV6G811_9TELE|nr:hypothetical protein AALO_G00190400 [Alosa alosa]